ncbi:MAG: hypothetical protein HUU56_01445 [Bdellovibrionaceae bacterium]|nr:hypothetical protein [Pseudobdellovibrionaceae bacterium]
MKLLTDLNQVGLGGQEELAVDDLKVSSRASLSLELTNLEQFVYKEMADLPLQSISDLERLSENIETLKQLSGRLNFIMKEISYLITIKKF